MNQLKKNKENRQHLSHKQSGDISSASDTTDEEAYNNSD